MQTKNIFKTLALAMLMPTMLLTTACSSEDDLVNNTVGESTASTKGYPFPVTVNVTREGDKGSNRASYNDNGDGTGSLAFSAGDKLFVAGNDGEAGQFAGTLDYDAVSKKFSGTMTTQNKYTGTIDDLMASASAVLLPAGYESYGFYSVSGSGYEATVDFDFEKAFALTKAAAVEQFSFEYASSYSSGFALAPGYAIVSFTISGLTANKKVDVSFEVYGKVISGNVTTSAEGDATFALGLFPDYDLEDCTLTVDGNNIAMPTKTTEAGHIYKISRSALTYPIALSAVTSSYVGSVVTTDGNVYANVAAAKAAGTTACAIIAYVGSETGESQNHGLAIAMKDAAAGNYVMWSSSNNDESLLTNYTDVSQAVSTFQSGLSNSQNYEFDNASNYPAFYAALHNTITTSDGISDDVSAFDTSGWFLPSLYQWNKIVQGLSGQSANLSDDSNDNYTASSLNAKITAAGGDGLQDDAYWSSTEYDGAYAWLFYAGGGLVTNKSEKYGEYCVRSVFAF